MRTAVVALLFVSVGLFFYLNDGGVTLGPGVKAPDAPLQEKISSAESFTVRDYRITPLAKFHIRAKVLSRENYWRGRESDLSPVDFALGWQRMSDEAILEHMDISQSNRWYFWRVDQFPIPRKEIETSSANMHLIPANDAVGSHIDVVRKGEIVEFNGYLVRVDAEDGWRWVSSLSRSDRGNHSCEVVWVENLRVVP